MERQNQYDHPHRVSLRKAQLVDHVQQDHPFGRVVTPEKELKKTSMAELKEVHEQLHDGFEDGDRGGTEKPSAAPSPEELRDGERSWGALDAFRDPKAARITDHGTLVVDYDEVPGKLQIVQRVK